MPTFPVASHIYLNLWEDINFYNKLLTFSQDIDRLVEKVDDRQLLLQHATSLSFNLDHFSRLCEQLAI